MDHLKLLTQVDRLVDACETYLQARELSDWDKAQESRAEIVRCIPVAKRITPLVPGAPEPAAFDSAEDHGWEFAASYDAALQLQGLLQVHAELTEALEAPDPAASLDLARFHPTVWGAAAALWADGHHRNAIHAAAAQLEAALQAKLGREDVSGAALVREAFSLNPPAPGKPRLRFAWLNEGSEAYRSGHEGAMAYGVGCFQLIRNSAAHRPVKLLPEIATEHLASLSFLSRVIDSATVRTAPGAPAAEARERPFG